MSELKITVGEQLQRLQMLMHRAAFSRCGKTHNPYRGQGRVLAILKLKPEMSQRELTYLLNVSKQSAAELIGKLEKDGYITRESSEEDKRVMTVRLTEKGAQAAENAADNSAESISFLDCLNTDELTAFSEYLSRIIEQYQAQFPGEDFELHRREMEDFRAFYGHGPHPGRGGQGFERGGCHAGGGHHHGRHGGPGRHGHGGTPGGCCRQGGGGDDGQNQ